MTVESMADYFDVLIIGAGISGIDAAYRIHERNSHLRYAILERRNRLGGTWDLFRYPGVRSDSDIFTLSYPFEPWQRPEAIADGEDIWQYLADTARKYHIDEHIQLGTYVRSADWTRPPIRGACRPSSTEAPKATAAGEVPHLKVSAK